jgi:RNA polymerase sigma factor (sigma-70 family)
MVNQVMNRVLQGVRKAVLLRGDSGPSDATLLDDFLLRSDELAFEALVRRHGPLVLGVCRRLLGNSHDAEDVFQAVFLILLQKAHSIRSRSALGAWLYGVAYRTSLKARAGRKIRNDRETPVASVPERGVAMSAPTDDLTQLLDEELNALPEKYRVPVILCELQGKSRREAARTLTLAEGTLSSRLATARKLMRARLARRGVVLSAAALSAAFVSMTSAAVPVPLALATVKAATATVMAEVTAGVVSAKVLALKEGMVKAMFLTKLKIGAGLLLALILVGGSVLLLGTGASAQVPVAPPSAEALQKVGKPAQEPGSAPGRLQPGKPDRPPVAAGGEEKEKGDDKKVADKVPEAIWPGWFFDKRVQTELRFTEEQKKQLSAVVNDISKKYEADLKEAQAESKDGMISKRVRELAEKRHVEQTKALQEAAPKILSTRAINRLYQIQRQERGVHRLIQDAAVQKSLKLDDAQVKQIETLLKEAAPAAQREQQKLLGPGPQGLLVENVAAVNQEVYSKVMDKILATFTAEQRRIWDDLVGEPFAFTPKAK